MGVPTDIAQWVALGLFLGFALLRPRWLLRGSDRTFGVALSLVALLLSALYVSQYLRGGPRIIDATAYFLEARAMADGHFSIPIADSPSSFLGRFLILSNAAEHRAISIFPPGYPAVLSLGFLLGVPMMVGPLLAAAITWTTGALAQAVGRSFGRLSDPHWAVVPRMAMALSVVCAALRYHTADTMSHGLAALCFALTLTAVLRAPDAAKHRLVWWMVAGLALGWLVATRPVSAMACAIAASALLVRQLRRMRRDQASLRPLLIGLGGILVAMAPGIALLLYYQHVALGEWFGSTQLAYYATTDGPPGCFRYGFGQGIGCLNEHGDFVRNNLPNGYGVYEATATTLRRLKAHGVDAVNAEPLLLGLLVVVLASLRLSCQRWLLAVIGLQIAVYAPFYFDGNYPGGGGRFFADVLPIEHVALSIGAVFVFHQYASRRATRMRPDRMGEWIVAAAVLGFALRAGFDHGLLRDREGGRPMFEPNRIEGLMASNSVKPLIFFDTDHGFNLAFDGAPGRAFDAARFRGDDTDWLLWHRRGRPSSYRYQFRWADAPAAPSLQPLSFASTMAEPIEIEVESLVPVATHDAFIGMDYQNGCRPDAHGLRVELTADVARVEMLATAPPCDRVQMWFYADIPPGVVAGLGADRLAARRVGPCDELGPIVRPVTAQGTVYIDFIASLEMAPRSAQSTATPEDGPPNGARRLSLDRLTMRCFPGTE